MNRQNYNLRIVLTPLQIARANDILFEIARNLYQINHDTQKYKSLTDDERVALIEKIDYEDHLTFKSMKYAEGIGDIDNLCDNRDCGCFSTPTQSSGEKGKGDK